MPAVLSPEEVTRPLEAAPGPKYKAVLSAAYAAGLRVSEVVALKVSDIDSERLLCASSAALVKGQLVGVADDKPEGVAARASRNACSLV
jgi:site-specific recombinase XerD